MINLGHIMQGEQGTLTVPWEFPVSSPASLIGAAITAVARNRETGAVTIITGSITPATATTATWLLSVGDSGTTGAYGIVFRAIINGVSTYTLEASLVIDANPAATSVQNPMLVGVADDDASWLAAVAGDGDAGQVLTANGVGGASWEDAATGIQEPASAGLWARLVDGVGSWLAATTVGAALFAAVDAAAARLAIGAAALAGDGVANELMKSDAAGNPVRSGILAGTTDQYGGVALGTNSVSAFSGVALGPNAVAAYGSVQLGEGTNQNGGLQFLNYQIVDADGNIPADRMTANLTPAAIGAAVNDGSGAVGEVMVSDSDGNAVRSGYAPNVDGLEPSTFVLRAPDGKITGFSEEGTGVHGSTYYGYGVVGSALGPAGIGGSFEGGSGGIFARGLYGALLESYNLTLGLRLTPTETPNMELFIALTLAVDGQPAENLVQVGANGVWTFVGPNAAAHRAAQRTEIGAELAGAAATAVDAHETTYDHTKLLTPEQEALLAEILADLGYANASEALTAVGDGSVAFTPAAGLGSNTFTGDQNLNGNELYGYRVREVAASVSGTYIINLLAGNLFVLTVTGNVTITFSNAPATGAAASATVILIQDTTGGHSVTFTGAKWDGGVAPDLALPAGQQADLSFIVRGSGADIRGYVAGLNMAVAA